MATTTQTKTQDTNQQKVSSRDKQLFPPLKVNVLTMCEDLLEIHDRMKEDLQQIKTTGNTDEKLKFLTRAILEMREILDSWPSLKVEVYVPPFAPSDDLSKLLLSLDLYLWDVSQRIEALRLYCNKTENATKIIDMYYEVRQLKWVSKTYQRGLDILELQVDDGGSVKDKKSKKKDKEKEKDKKLLTPTDTGKAKQKKGMMMGFIDPKKVKLSSSVKQREKKDDTSPSGTPRDNKKDK
eukprot:TRINITY_DN2305_c0_g1_i2.p1 TRINITY_DN2305_c0_g1~~TRINITY_DN2305_c0_g1_i2.p1  ORF type:complete len:238 (-),score=77.65 TRINITY_DN2305_c0_g1_i2:182-895(-)